MKLHRFFAILAGVGLVLSACNKTEEDPAMSISPEVLNFEAGAASQTVSVTCNTNWKVSTTLPEWLELSVKEHSGSKSAVEVTVTVLANDGYDRSVGIVFNGGTRAKKTLTVNQKGGAKATTIADVKKMLTVTTEAGNPLPANVTITGIVVSNRQLNNLSSKKAFFVQDETAGINIYCVADHSLDFGDKVAIDVSGLTIKKYKDLHEIDGVPLENISKLGSEEVTPIEVSVADLLANKYEGMYISVKEVCQVAEADLAKTWVMENKATSINIVAKNGATFVVRSSQYSTFASEKVPQGSGTICGISSIYNDAIQLVFAQPTDYNTLTADRFDIEVEKITTTKISEVLKASPGAEITLKNVTVVATAITNPTTTQNTSFLVIDADKDYLFIYDTDTPGIKVGDNVTVVGTLGSYSGVPQIGGPTVTINSTGGSVTHPAAVDITEGFDTYVGSGHKHVSFVGTYSPNGTYHNVQVRGASTATGSFLTPAVIDVTPFVDVPNVKFTGYYLYPTSGGKYHYIILTGVEASTEPYLSVSPTEISASATQTSANFNISSNVSWTCTSKTSGFSVGKTSGNGNETITVTFSENTDTDNTRTATIEVVSEVGTKTVTITQAKATDPSQTVLELTNEEIVAGIKVATDAGANGYTDVTITSTSGTWTGQMNAQANKTTKEITSPFIQLRGKGGAHLLSPAFSKNVDKIELVLAADKNDGQVRDLYVVPSSTSLPSGDYTNDTVATNYGMVSTTGTPGETVTINFNSDTNNFMLIVKKSATYIDSIKVYLKK